MRTYLQTLLGAYVPFQNPNGDYVSSLAGADWEFIIGGILLIVIYHFLFKCLFSIFFHK